jgi:hypothetical protein
MRFLEAAKDGSPADAIAAIDELTNDWVSQIRK